MKSMLYGLFAWESSSAMVIILALLVLCVVLVLVKLLTADMPSDPLLRDLLDAEFERRHDHYNGQ